ncbi:MAG: type II toxin-antitoxin system ParD family antitoxin [Cyanosarcina radialis HA8281-LM2]|jgi:putative addiction module CopG family antidote|nr:type II toxin-antitoxin system ParD family antitoxin [Cyanosarcina radialis HA8281-LM2]
MNILLTSEQVQRIQQQLDTGRYASAAEVIDEALKLLETNKNQPRRGKKMLAVFEKTGFMGSLPDSDPHLSSDYKAIVRTEMGLPRDSR